MKILQFFYPRTSCVPRYARQTSRCSISACWTSSTWSTSWCQGRSCYPTWAASRKLGSSWLQYLFFLPVKLYVRLMPLRAEYFSCFRSAFIWTLPSDRSGRLLVYIQRKRNVGLYSKETERRNQTKVGIRIQRSMINIFHVLYSNKSRQLCTNIYCVLLAGF